MEIASTAARILLVDDDPDILEFLEYNLRSKGYVTATAPDGMEALRVAKSFRPNLVLMDVMMPRKDGISAMKELRQTPGLEDAAIILLTALSDEKNEIAGLQHGADDYITKPIKPALLLTRVAAALRRVHRDESILVFGDIEINRSKFSVHVRGEEVSLAKKEFELLALLASRAGHVFPRSEILRQVWGSEVIVGDRTIDVHVRKIRQKTGVDLIRTVKGVGYKFEIF